MKHDANEVQALEKAVEQATSGVCELADLELVLIGGGTGEVVMV